MTREMTSASMLIPSDPTNQTVVSSSPVAPMPGNSFRASQRRFSLYCGAALITVATVSQTHAQSAPKETPLSVVNALHAAFGQHHDRAVHTKGTILEGTFTPAPEARTIVRTPVFAGGPRPVVARFSLFAGVPTLPDNDDGAAPSGFAVKIKALDGDDFDIEANQHHNFIVATFDEFAVFMRALGATKPDTPHPTPVEQFLSTHPTARVPGKPDLSGLLRAGDLLGHQFAEVHRRERPIGLCALSLHSARRRKVPDAGRAQGQKRQLFAGRDRAAHCQGAGGVRPGGADRREGRQG